MAGAAAEREQVGSCSNREAGTVEPETPDTASWACCMGRPSESWPVYCPARALLS